MKVIIIEDHNDVNEFNHEMQLFNNKKDSFYDAVMAGFFMENCPACEGFKPEWDKFENYCSSKKTQPNVLVAKVPHHLAANLDFDTSKLNGFPTVLGQNKQMIKKKRVKMFDGERSMKSLKSFLNSLVHKKNRRHHHKKSLRNVVKKLLSRKKHPKKKKSLAHVLKLLTTLKRGGKRGGKRTRVKRTKKRGNKLRKLLRLVKKQSKKRGKSKFVAFKNKKARCPPGYKKDIPQPGSKFKVLCRKDL